MPITVNTDTRALGDVLEDMADLDEGARLYAHMRLATYCEPYVPMETGMLAQNMDITEDYVEYRQPYAHYQYEGEIYGPNTPVRDENGTVVGYFSPPNQKKNPTGRPLTYSRELHPLATDHWERAAMAARMDDLLNDIAQYLSRYGGGDK